MSKEINEVIFAFSRKWTHKYLSSCSRDICARHEYLVMVPTNTLYRNHTWLSTAVVNMCIGKTDRLVKLTDAVDGCLGWVNNTTQKWPTLLDSMCHQLLNSWCCPPPPLIDCHSEYWLRVHYLTGVMCAQWFDQWCGRQRNWKCKQYFWCHCICWLASILVYQ